ncbi:MAG TPA: DMT family transporter [Candidatus Binatus sp.]|nr:DMT family transporter [Candidatus Binatus sp.]
MTAAERRGALFVAGAALLWSTGGLGIKAIAEPPLTVACCRSGVAALTLLALFRPRRPHLTPAFALTVVSYAACLTTFVVATKWTTAANAIFLQYSGVVWILLLSPLVLAEPLRARDAIAIGLALAGMALFLAGHLDPGARAGDAVALVSGVLYAALVMSLRHQRGAPAEAATIYGNVLLTLALLPVVARGPLPSWGSAAVLLFLGSIQIAGANVLFLRGLKSVTATQASLVGMIEPIANPVWVFLVLGERPGLPAALGAVIVLGAIAWHTLGARAADVPLTPPPD